MLSSGAREAGVGGDRPQRRANERIGRVLFSNRARRQDEWRQPSTPNGELFTKTDSETGEVWTYHYDALGNLLSVDLPDGRLIEYVIDGQNRRIGKRIDGVLTKAWLYKDQLKPIAELDGSGNLVARFIYGSKTNVPDVILRYAAGTVSRYRVISDHLGSPVMAVNVDNPAEVPFAAEYTAFGEMTVTSGASNDWMPFGFAGGLYDADTDLVRIGARDYDAVIGRWTAKDPVRWDGHQWNAYVYGKNDPVNFADRNGREPANVEECSNLALSGLRSCLETCSGGILGMICSLFNDAPQRQCEQSCGTEYQWQIDACELVMPPNYFMEPNEDLPEPTKPGPVQCWDWDCYAQN